METLCVWWSSKFTFNILDGGLFTGITLVCLKTSNIGQPYFICYLFIYYFVLLKTTIIPSSFFTLSQDSVSN